MKSYSTSFKTGRLEIRFTTALFALVLSSVATNILFSNLFLPIRFATNQAWSQRPGLKCGTGVVAGSKEHLPAGKHHIVDMYGIPERQIKLLESSVLLQEIPAYIAEAGLTLLDYSAHHFDCGGITAVFLLSESHVSLHSWPEHGFVAIDVYTCGSGRPEVITEKFKHLLQPVSVKHTYVERGASKHFVTAPPPYTPLKNGSNPNSTVSQSSMKNGFNNKTVSQSSMKNGFNNKTVSQSSCHMDYHPIGMSEKYWSESSHLSMGGIPEITTVQDDDDSNPVIEDISIPVMDKSHVFLPIKIPESDQTPPRGKTSICVNGDDDEDDCFMLRNVQVLADVQSEFQHVEVIDTQNLGRCMLLDRVIQFCEEDNEVYTSELTTSAMSHALKHKHAHEKLKIVIIGGGDGWVASHLLDNYSARIESIELVDIDAYVARLTHQFFDPVGLSSSFIDPKVRWTFQDAGRWLADLPAHVQPNSIDVAIIDCTDHTKLASQILYTEQFYTNVYNLLNDKGVMVQQMNTEDDAYAPFFQLVRDQWNTIGFSHVQEWSVYLQSYSGMSLFWLTTKT